MRYILDNNGYIEEIIFGGMIDCNNKSCTEYIGDIPEGYTSLVEWADNANIRAYKITDNNLVYDSAKDIELQEKWKIEEVKERPFVMWTNPNPNENFEKQHINLSTDDYDMYEVFYRETTTSGVVLSVKGIAGQSVLLSSPYGYENKVATRGFYRVQGKKKEFNIEVAYFGGNKTANNSYLIPLYIIGYKIGLNLSIS